MGRCRQTVRYWQVGRHAWGRCTVVTSVCHICQVFVFFLLKYFSPCLFASWSTKLTLSPMGTRQRHIHTYVTYKLDDLTPSDWLAGKRHTHTHTHTHTQYKRYIIPVGDRSVVPNNPCRATRRVYRQDKSCGHYKRDGTFKWLHWFWEEVTGNRCVFHKNHCFSSLDIFCFLVSSLSRSILVSLG